MPFTQRLTIRFDQVDYARVVYYPRFFELSHQVFEAFFEQAVGVSYPKMLMDRKVGFPTVHAEADFKRPLKFGDEVDVTVRLPGSALPPFLALVAGLAPAAVVAPQDLAAPVRGRSPG